MEDRRQMYERLVRISVLMDEALNQAVRAADVASTFKNKFAGLAAGSVRADQLATVLADLRAALEKSSACTQEASTLFEAA